MNLLYVANVRMPTEKAHGAQIMKTCEAFARAGRLEALIVSDRKTPITDDPFAYYGIRQRFTLLRARALDTVAWGRFGFLLSTLSFGLTARRMARRYPNALVYGRDEIVLWLLARSGRKIVWESHTAAWNSFAREVALRAERMVVITQGLKEFYTERGISVDKITVVHDGVDLADFATDETKVSARDRLDLPHDTRIALYAGRLDGWKGTDTLLAAAKLLPEGIEIAVIGGEPHQIRRLAQQHPRVRFLGARPYRELAQNLAVADILVLPNTGRDPVSVRFTSPLKLFAYMAAGKPIVASDLPSLREVLDDGCAYFVTPDDAVALAARIQEAMIDPAAQAKTAAARTRAAHYSWDARAEAILEALP